MNFLCYHLFWVVKFSFKPLSLQLKVILINIPIKSTSHLVDLNFVINFIGFLKIENHSQKQIFITVIKFKYHEAIITSFDKV